MRDKFGGEATNLVPLNKLTSDHPVLTILRERQIPQEHYDKFFLCHKFYEWANIRTSVPRRDEHPRLVIPFYDEDGEWIHRDEWELRR